MKSTIEKEWITEVGLKAKIKTAGYTSSRPVEEMRSLGLDGEWYCGYILVDKTHPLYGKGYSEKLECLKGIVGEDTPIGERGILPYFATTDIWTQWT